MFLKRAKKIIDPFLGNYPWPSPENTKPNPAGNQNQIGHFPKIKKPASSPSLGQCLPPELVRHTGPVLTTWGVPAQRKVGGAGGGAGVADHVGPCVCVYATAGACFMKRISSIPTFPSGAPAK